MNDAARLLADFLRRREAAAELQVCERTLYRWRRLGQGPPTTRLGRRVLYKRSSLLEWLRGREDYGHADNDDEAGSSRPKGRGGVR